MRYEEYKRIGEYSEIKEFEGTPEEIARLMNLQSKQGKEKHHPKSSKPPSNEKRYRRG